MPTPVDDDEFERIKRVERIQRAREILAQYEDGMAFYRRQIEDDRYQIGRLDERLGGNTQ
jgi:hypothetical protein